jgi:hypothetical protein
MEHSSEDRDAVGSINKIKHTESQENAEKCYLMLTIKCHTFTVIFILIVYFILVVYNILTYNIMYILYQ